jgi:hypothetical protein
MDSFWDVMWFVFVSFAFVAYLMVLFRIFGDLFRDPDTSGIVKSVWIVALILVPLITSLVYLIVRGRGMVQRDVEGVAKMRKEQDAYIRDVAGSHRSPAEEIAHAREMLDAGLITQPEFDRLKEKALV